MSKLYVVGLGPGASALMTAQAREAMEAADVLCGYTAYIKLVEDLYPEKEKFATPMMGEVERCKKALELASSGKNVAMVCSGDAGVYGMAGLILELAEDPDVEISVVAGVTAALSGGAVLGAPLTHDFCVISLSDLMTDWALIEKRLRCAAMGDFGVALYNPSSKKRHDYLQKACDIMMEAGKAPETVCGWVRNIGREGECCRILTLAELREEQVDMFTTVFIGNSKTREINGRMVTPRGYGEKYGVK